MMNWNWIATQALSLAVLTSFIPPLVTAAGTEVSPTTKIVVLGTQGGPVPGVKRAQPASAVVVGDRIYLVDAGNGVVRQLVLAHLDYRRVDHIFITHNHDDHNADWGTLMGLQWSTGRATPVHVYGPSGTGVDAQGFFTVFRAEC